MDTYTEAHSLDDAHNQLSVGFDFESVFLVCLHTTGDRMVNLDPDEAYSFGCFLEWLADPIERDAPAIDPPRRASAALVEDPTGNRSVTIVIANDEDLDVTSVRLSLDDTMAISAALYRASVYTSWLG